MGLIRAIVSIAADSTLPRDRIVNTLYFDVTNVPGLIGTDADALAQDLADIYSGRPGIAHGHEVNVRIYNMDDPKPRPVAGQATNNSGLAPASNAPREVACCLSFYADRNLPRRRGRIYWPAFLWSPSSVRPLSADRDDLLGLADALSALGGVNVDWCVYSPTGTEHNKVTHAYVDDEWDTMRSRGLRATSRRERDVSG